MLVVANVIADDVNFFSSFDFHYIPLLLTSLKPCLWQAGPGQTRRNIFKRGMCNYMNTKFVFSLSSAMCSVPCMPGVPADKRSRRNVRRSIISRTTRYGVISRYVYYTKFSFCVGFFLFGCSLGCTRCGVVLRNLVVFTH